MTSLGGRSQGFCDDNTTVFVIKKRDYGGESKKLTKIRDIIYERQL